MRAPFRTIDELRITKACQGVTKLNLHQGVHAMVYYFSKTMPVGFDEAAARIQALLRKVVEAARKEGVYLIKLNLCELGELGHTPRE